MEKIIKNELNYIQKIFIIKKKIIVYSQKPWKRRISDVCAQSQSARSFLHFKAKLQRKLLRNQLNYTNGGIFS